MRFQVPQFVDIEDKIVGPLTLKQFLIYVVAVLLLIPVFLAADISLFLTLAIPILGVAAAFAHFRWHGKSLFSIIVNTALFYSRGSLYIWRRTDEGKPFTVGEDVRQMWREALPDVDQAEASSHLREIARELEIFGNVTKTDELDPMIPEEEQKKTAAV